MQILADLVRARALLLPPAGHEVGGLSPLEVGGLSPLGGWFIDGDTVWLNRVPSLSLGDPACVAHFFGSLASHSSIQGKTRDEFDRFRLVNYLVRPGDQAHIASPFASPAESPVLARWVSALEHMVLSKVTKYRL